MDKYRLWCVTDSTYERVIASAVPTVCPTNGAHTIKTTSIAIIEHDVLVNDGSFKELPLADYKQLRYNEIDGKTVSLIAAGFSFDSQAFSLSSSAQMNWSTLKDQEAEFTWPVEVSTKDNNAYSLTQANLTAFWTAGRDATKGHLDTGRALKKSVFDAADEAAVNAVVDNR